MQHLKNLNQSPPGNFHYRDSRSGHTMAALNLRDLLGKVAAHRANMGYPAISEGFPSLAVEIDDAICQALSPEDQTALCTDGTPPVRRPSGCGCGG